MKGKRRKKKRKKKKKNKMNKITPRFLIDIKRRKPSRLNLSFQPVTAVPLKSIIQVVFILLISLSFVFGSVVAPTSSSVKAAQSQNEEQRKALETQLADLENQISQYETKIGEYQKQGTGLKTEIKKLEAKIAKLNLQIKAVNLTLKNLDAEISSTQGKINQTESEIDYGKQNLSQTLQTLYENDNKNLVEVLIANPKLSDFVGDLNNLLSVQDNLRLTIQKIAESHQKLVDQKEVLALQREDAVSLKAYQDAQKSSIQKTQTEKNTILKTTKGKEAEYQKILTETKKTAAEIRKQIFNLLGGGELTFEQAYELAKVAEKVTGIRAALILAVLDRESALGKNVGKCDYKTAMHPTRDIPIFLALVEDLGLKSSLDSGNLKVSCANSDGAYGGAMGPAQFIPSTWNIYKDKVAEITGNNPASPWQNVDAFMATALYLKDAGAGPNATLAQEKQAAAKYYAGSRWRNYLSTYGARVIAQAEQFQDDIDVLNS